MQVLGIDVGGSGIKGAPVDTTTGELLAPRYRIPTPQPPTPTAMIDVMADIAAYFDWQGAIGCGFPGVVKRGTIYTAANVDEHWIGFNLQTALQNAAACSVTVVNDADAACLAEMEFGAGRGRGGLVVMVTLGTGIGVSAIINGVLIPNLELGHIEIDGEDAEKRAADSAREREELSWKKWAKRVDKYLYRLEKLIYPDLYIIGGGVSKEWDKFAPFFSKTSVETVPAELRNEAGIVGAAMAAIQETSSIQR